MIDELDALASAMRKQKQGDTRRIPRLDCFYEEGEPTSSYLEVFCCGEWMYSNAFTNTCLKCGKDYNWAGLLLLPRDQWEPDPAGDEGFFDE